MFYSQRDIKSIYPDTNSPSIEYILSLMNKSNEQLDELLKNLKLQYIQHKQSKLEESGKTPEEIQQYFSTPEFATEVDVNAQQMLKNEIIRTLSDSTHIGEKVKILTSCIRKLPEEKKLLILKGMYKLAFLQEMNQTMQDMSNKDFEALIKVIIVCSHLKTDITPIQKQVNLQEAIAAHQRETGGFSLDVLSKQFEELTGIDVCNLLQSIKKKLNFGKQTDAKQHLESLDEILLQSSLSTPLVCSVFLITALTLSMPGLGGALLPLFVIGIIGKNVHAIVTHDRNKERTIHNPFPESITHQPLTPEEPKNYAAMLEQQQSTKQSQGTPSKYK
ncbi:hypothetical protein [Ehrlichia ruminantium]|uniref:hypothetical protein n=1 Tax=Ehrlichia ruminantium TaxID=779 RepID=UPI000994BBBA|nr:hypothetical protein [Ehrlichia ruminantium]